MLKKDKRRQGRREKNKKHIKWIGNWEKRTSLKQEKYLTNLTYTIGNILVDQKLIVFDLGPFWNTTATTSDESLLIDTQKTLCCHNCSLQEIHVIGAIFIHRHTHKTEDQRALNYPRVNSEQVSGCFIKQHKDQ